MGDIELQVFADRLKELRDKENITQKDFAEKIGVTAAALSAYENNIKNPSISVAKRIAEAFDISIDWLCGLTDKINNNEALLTYSDIIKLFLKIQDSGLAPNEFSLIAHEEYNTFSETLEKRSGIITEDQTFYKIICDIKKMQDILNSGTIDQSIYNTWIDGFLDKYDIPFTLWDSITPSDK